ncbi:hypothetical protein GIB67_032446 [Kingdonia uniflora]|uniref:R13L1/DRL21-like LRR repeat region domain-containing protein n=1 Tax=Kingdonia uniflora TaxID=39325 RepID=A0A7J7LT13_9MAGN|nr:hypothetical protein GIB67_032446 [Kingdonia uniflora]
MFSAEDERRIPVSIWNLKSLRTLRMQSRFEFGNFLIDCQDLSLLSDLTSLRTLDLSCRRTKIRKLPKEIEKLIHLRYLDLSSTGCYSLQCLPRGIGKLRDLETLSNFIVSEEGADIGELKDLNNLHGKLAISNIKGVGKEASHEAILKDKEYLHHLSLGFRSTRFDLLDALNNDDDEAVQSVLEFLEPHPNLEKLEVNYYNGSKFPSWMEFPNWEGRSIMLRTLEIRFCRNLKVLPALGRLEFLEDLNLYQLDSVSQMGLEVLGVLKNGDSSAAVIAFPNLKKLSIDEMKHWEEWVIKTTVNITLMPLLQTLRLYECPMLKSLPCQILSSSLREMTIVSCPHLEVSYLPLFLEELTLGNDAGSLSISLPIQDGLHTNLNSLNISNSPHATLPQGLSQLMALQTLKVSNCNSLTCIPDELQHLSSLKRLQIYECPILGPCCQKEVGEYWNIISHIPNIYIDRKRIQ